MCEDKRKRSPNWLPAEKELLLSLVESYFNIIENKKTDGVTVKSKLAQWQIIADKYNSRTSHCSRTGDNLKAQWESMKKVARKAAANTRKHMIQTGGGPGLPPSKEDPFLQRILSLITTSAVGLFNPFDSDSIVPVDPYIEDEAATSVIQTEDFHEPLLTQDTHEPTLTQDIDISKVVHSTEGPIPDPDIIYDTQEDWGDYTPQLLRKPVSLPLKVANINKENLTHPICEKTRISRRRPTHSNGSLEILHKKKIEAIDFNKKLAEEEMAQTKILHEINVNIAKQKLLQERIKTNMLKIRRRKLLASIRK